MKTLFSILFLFISLSSAFCQAPDYADQTAVGINGLYFSTNMRKFLFIYEQTELAAFSSPITGSTKIDTLWFRFYDNGGLVTTAGAYNFTNLSVTLGHTTLLKNSPSLTFANNYNVNGSTNCLNTASYSLTAQLCPFNPPYVWSYIAFSTPFCYDGVSNLAIEIAYSNVNYTNPSPPAVQSLFAANGSPFTAQPVFANSATATTGAFQVFGAVCRPVIGLSGCIFDATITNITNATCNAGGSATVGITCPTSVSYTWTSGDVTPTANNLAPGTYTVTVSDVSCITSTINLPVTIAAAPNSLSATATVTVPPDCSSPTGTVVITVLSGTGPYDITGDATLSGVSSPITLTGQALGLLNYTITDVSTGCSTTANVTINGNNNQPTISITTLAQLNCINSTVVLSGSSTTPGVTYQWTNGPASASYSVNSGGTYTLTVTDPINGCTNTASVAIVANTTLPDISIANPTQLSCNNPSVTLNGSSTTAGVTYQWTNGPATPSYLTGIAGAYTLTVTDPSNGCSAVANVTVSSIVAIPNASIAPPVELNCTNSTVTLNGNSTSLGVNYQWTNGPPTVTYTVNAAGVYTLTVTDPSNGCSATASVIVTSNTAIPNMRPLQNPRICFHLYIF